MCYCDLKLSAGSRSAAQLLTFASYDTHVRKCGAMQKQVHAARFRPLYSISNSSSIQSLRRLHGCWELRLTCALRSSVFQNSDKDCPKHDEIMHHPSAAKLETAVSVCSLIDLWEGIHRRIARKMKRGARLETWSFIVTSRVPRTFRASGEREDVTEVDGVEVGCLRDHYRRP
jgi:hypothetical protein